MSLVYPLGSMPRDRAYTVQDTAEKLAVSDSKSPGDCTPYASSTFSLLVGKRRRKNAQSNDKVTAIDIHFQDNDRMLVGSSSSRGVLGRVSLCIPPLLGSAGGATLYNRGTKTNVCTVTHVRDCQGLLMVIL